MNVDAGFEARRDAERAYAGRRALHELTRHERRLRQIAQAREVLWVFAFLFGCMLVGVAIVHVIEHGIR